MKSRINKDYLYTKKAKFKKNDKYIYQNLYIFKNAIGLNNLVKSKSMIIYL
jgi:hypothetical protein